MKTFNFLLYLSRQMAMPMAIVVIMIIMIQNNKTIETVFKNQGPGTQNLKSNIN